MFDKQEVCQKIVEIYPVIGSCETDVEAFYSKEDGSWMVELKKGEHSLLHHLDEHDIKDCMDGKQCFSLGIDIAQLKKY